MQTPLIDLSFLYEIADNDPGYIGDVLDIFLDTMPPGLEKLEKLVRETDDWEGVYKQAHFLKSSASIVKVKDMFEQLNTIELLAKDKTDKERIVLLLDNVLIVFNEAHPLLIEEKNKQRLNAQ